MVVQTSFSLLQKKGYAGLVGDGWSGTDIRTKLVGAGGVNPGLLVVQSGGLAVAPDGYLFTGLLGIVVRETGIEPSVSSDPLYPEDSHAPVLTKGRVWVVAEDAASFTIGQEPFVRVTANGGNTTLGAFASTAGTGLIEFAASPKICEVVDIDAGAGLVLVNINLV